MRKLMMLGLSLLAAAPAFASEAAQPGPDSARHMHRQQMIEARKGAGETTRDESTRKASGPKEESKMSKFWKSEGERSGLGNSGQRMGTWVSNLNPVPFFKRQEQRYNERKAGGAAQK